jgi:hypothetical protein
LQSCAKQVVLTSSDQIYQEDLSSQHTPLNILKLKDIHIHFLLHHQDCACLIYKKQNESNTIQESWKLADPQDLLQIRILFSKKIKLSLQKSKRAQRSPFNYPMHELVFSDAGLVSIRERDTTLFKEGRETALSFRD